MAIRQAHLITSWTERNDTSFHRLKRICVSVWMKGSSNSNSYTEFYKTDNVIHIGYCTSLIASATARGIKNKELLRFSINTLADIESPEELSSMSKNNKDYRLINNPVDLFNAHSTKFWSEVLNCEPVMGNNKR